MKRESTTDAVEIMHRRYVKGDKKRLASIKREKWKLNLIMKLVWILEKVCPVITFGQHWWKYYPGKKRYVRCRLCGRLPKSMWKIIEKVKIRDFLRAIKREVKRRKR